MQLFYFADVGTQLEHNPLYHVLVVNEVSTTAKYFELVVLIFFVNLYHMLDCTLCTGKFSVAIDSTYLLHSARDELSHD